MSRQVTTQLQFEIIVAFMEQHGDLCKPSGGARGRGTNAEWRQLELALNRSGSGDPRTADKWKKVWTCYKSKVIKKAAEVHRAATRSGGGPADEAGALTDLEQRVLTIVNPRSAVGLDVPQLGLEHFEFELIPPPEAPTSPTSATGTSVPQYTLTQAFEWPSASRELPPTPALAPEPVQPASARIRSDSSRSAAPQVPRRRPRGRTATSTPGRLRGRSKQPTAVERASAYFVTADREMREHQRRRDVEERRFREVSELRQEASELRREALERRWQDLFERYINALERSAQPPPQ